MTTFIKVSGDLLEHESAIDFIVSVAKTSTVIVCVGGGTKISEEFRSHGIPIIFGPLGREYKNVNERLIAYAVLNEHKQVMQKRLQEKGIRGVVITPVIIVGAQRCPINGDQLVLAAYHGYDKFIILTLKKRLKKKQEQFAAYPKIEVVGL